ncbi:long-chain fatty acid--CoA ligase [Acidothermaceae bacterium B102]|nr:long-chain fatty acid--CoA ligase [Acidothermaceae bacterium B102]
MGVARVAFALVTADDTGTAADPDAAGPGTAAYDARPWLSSYPAEVPADYEFPIVPLTRFLDDAAASFPNNLAVTFLGTTLTYAQLRTDVDRFAGALETLGVTKGDRVALILPNCPQNVIAFYAILRLGAVVVQHNPLYTPTEMRHQLADCEAKVVITLDRAYATVAEVRHDTSIQHVVVTSIIDYLPRRQQLLLKLPISKARTKRAEISAVVPKNAELRQFTELLAHSPGPAAQAPIDPSTDLALLQYTGGTSGLSRGAMLTHANLVANAYQCRLWFTTARAGQEVTLAVLPLFHAYGLTLCLGLTVLLAGNLVLMPRFDLQLAFEAIDEWKPTLFPGVPPMYKAMLDSPDVGKHDLRSINECVSGAMKLPADIAAAFEQITGGRLVEGYGMTEASPVTHANPLTGQRRSGMIGIPIPGTLARVVDQDDPSIAMAVGEPGELVISGPQVMSGYWRAPDDADEAFTHDGYLRTGDIAVMDADGWFAVVDRKKELIIAGGFNIYPSEIEEVLYSMVGIADCVVVGVPDAYRGETVKAFVVLAPGATLSEADVKAYCAERLTAYKVPKLVEFRETLPRTLVGKILRRVLVAEEREKQAAAAGGA